GDTVVVGWGVNRRTVSIDQQEAPVARGNGAAPDSATPLVDRDVRRKRPTVLAFLLRLETLRKTLRVVSLLFLDYWGLLAALFTAHQLNRLVQGHFSVPRAWHETHRWFSFAYLVTVQVFARVDLYADRPRRPGYTRIASTLFQTTIIALIFALAEGQ